MAHPHCAGKPYTSKTGDRMKREEGALYCLAAGERQGSMRYQNAARYTLKHYNTHRMMA